MPTTRSATGRRAWHASAPAAPEASWPTRARAPVGWCHVAPRSAIPNLRDRAAAVDDSSPRPVVDPSEDPAAIVCFVIPPERRGSGVAKALLTGAVEASRRWGVPWLEAYPDQPGAPTDGPTSAADAYRGPLALFLGAGFEIVRDMGDWAVVRHDLGPDAG